MIGGARTRSLPLSKLLKRETKVAHRLVESTKVARAFFKGKLTREVYAEGLARLYPAYDAMEAALASLPADHRLAPFHLPSVFRREALQADLAYFGVSPEPIRAGAAQAYVARIHEAAEAELPLLAAHAYVRYMADVSGGLIAAKVAQKVLGLPSREGLSFMTFPAIDDPSAFRASFRAKLDALGATDAERAALVEEANVAFTLNRRLADELFERMDAA